MSEKIYAADFVVLDFIQQHLRTPALDALMRFFTYLGNGAAAWIALGLCLLAFKKYRPTALKMALAMIFGSLLWVAVLKNAVCRPRPFVFNDAVQIIINKPGGYSFPSGHSMVAFSCAAVIFLNHRRAGIAAFVVAALTAFSRMYLYVHFPSDVIFGALLGIFTGTAVQYIFKKFAKMPKTNTPRRE